MCGDYSVLELPKFRRTLQETQLLAKLEDSKQQVISKALQLQRFARKQQLPPAKEYALVLEGLDEQDMEGVSCLAAMPHHNSVQYRTPPSPSSFNESDSCTSLSGESQGQISASEQFHVNRYKKHIMSLYKKKMNHFMLNHK